MEKIFEVIRPETLFGVIVVGLAFINETVRFIFQLYYSTVNDGRCVYNRKLNIEYHFKPKDEAEVKTINRIFYFLAMVSLATGIIVMYTVHILAGFAAYIFLYVISVEAYIRYLLRRFRKGMAV